MPFLKRHFEQAFQALLKQFPAVCILGPRQCGKTTFAKLALQNWQYFDLEKPSHLAQIQNDVESFLDRHPEKIIFDEAHLLPSLFPVLRGKIDEERKKNGRFVLLGSASPTLIRNISETLAGRIGFLDMTPFHINEVGDLSKLWIRGGYPDAYLQNDDRRRFEWFEAYTRTFIERDLNLYGVDIQPSVMRKLMAMLGHVHGGLLNLSELGNSLGINYHTISRYLDILEQTFLIRRLSPFFTNIGKRLVKSPKVYIRDTGLLHYFLGIKNEEELSVHPKRGAGFEGFVIEQLIEWINLIQPGTQCFFWRTATKQETDFLIQFGKDKIPVEIKTQKAIQRSDVKEIFLCMKDLDLKKGYVVYPFEKNYSLGDGVEVLSLSTLLKKLT